MRHWLSARFLPACVAVLAMAVATVALAEPGGSDKASGVATDAPAAVPLPAAASPASKPAPSTSRPASTRPASEIVLVKVGPLTVTQADYNHEVRNTPREQIPFVITRVIQELIDRRLFSLYLREHPELVDSAAIQEYIDKACKEEGVENRQQLEAKLKARDELDKLHDYLDRVKVMLGFDELVRRAEKRAADEDLLRRMYENDKRGHDGSRVRVRHFLVAVYPWETPEQIKAKRQRIEQVRHDLLSGRRTWDQVINETDHVASRSLRGEFGLHARHNELPEPIMEAAFKLEIGETSDVVRTDLGFHLVQITEKLQGNFTFEKAKPFIRRWAAQEYLLKVNNEMRSMHEVIGVREPDLPPPTTQPAAKTAPSAGKAADGKPRAKTPRPQRPAQKPKPAAK